MKVSIIIPCYYTHAKYLEELCLMCAKTLNVEEVIVIYSGCSTIEETKIMSGGGFCLAPIYTHTYKERLYMGQAILEAEKIATGDILVIQAADDYPTKNRIERIIYYFNSYDIIALNHGFFNEEESKLKEIDTAEPKIITSQQLYDKYIKVENSDYGFGFGLGFPVIASPCAYRKEAIGNWSSLPRGQDHTTSKAILIKFNKTIITSEKLYYYFPSRSSINDR